MMSSSAQDTGATRPATILVVDDEEGVRLAVGQILEDEGYRVLQAADGDQALALFEEWQDDVGVVLLDLTMPGPDGKEVMRRLRHIRPQLSVIISSGYMQDADQDLPPNTAILPKPFGTEQLLQTLAKFTA